MEIVSGIKVKDLGLLIDDTLVIGDIHIGYEEALNKQGILMPRFQYEEIIVRLRKLLSGLKVKRIVINGDIKHEFGSISEQEWRDTLKLIDFLSKFGELVLVKGNHDTILGPIAEKRSVKVVDSLVIEDVFIVHGDKIVPVPDGVKTIVIGHEHPAVGLVEGAKREVYKCFLVGKWKKYNLIVMPSFNLVTEGTDVLKEKLLSPFLIKIDDFRVLIVADKVYDFGDVKELEKL